MPLSLEPRRTRWARRLRTIPSMLVATAVATVIAPFIVPLLAVTDVARAQITLPTAKAYLFALQYLINDTTEIVLSPLYWMRAGFGTQLASASSIQRHSRLQAWSVALLAKRAEQLLDLHVVVDPHGAPLNRPGPTIVIAPHTSVFDASLPSLLYQQYDVEVRGVLMAELAVDPGFDLTYSRAGSVFVPRSNGPEARLQIANLASGLHDRNVVCIFPEGRLFSQRRLERAKQKLAAEQPDRARRLTRLTRLTHTLPPRSGGLATLLANAPSADVVLIRHVGLSEFRPFRRDRRSDQETTVFASAVRFDRASIPTGEAAIGEWLDDVWIDLDLWIAAEQDSRSDSRPNA